MAKKSRGDFVLVLHNIRSVHNIGALFRTADAVGITRIVLSGYSPTPLDRFGRIRDDVAKASLGAEQSVPWSYVKTPTTTLKKLKQDGYVMVGLEQDARSVSYKKIKKTQKMVFVLGTETTGITKNMRDLCDVLAEIPMHGIKESLNVSVAGGIFLYRILD
jgi:tRNA G18 (ribose-2'-O)-methylase SpoU